MLYMNEDGFGSLNRYSNATGDLFDLDGEWISEEDLSPELFRAFNSLWNENGWANCYLADFYSMPCLALSAEYDRDYAKALGISYEDLLEKAKVNAQRVSECQEWNDFSKQHPGWRFFTSLEGKRLEIVGYDCPSLRPWFDGSVHGWNPIVTLSGRYSAYYSNGEVALIRGGDATQL